MYCRMCGNKLGDSDHYCQVCGTPAGNREMPAAPAETGMNEEVIFNPPYDNKPHFAEKDLKFAGEETNVPENKEEDLKEFIFEKEIEEEHKKEEAETKKEEHGEPESGKENEFMWNVHEFPKASRKTEEIELNWNLDEFSRQEKKKAAAEAFEEELFQEIREDANRIREQNIDRFFTFSRKNEEFQKLLDQEYERFRMRTGAPEFSTWERTADAKHAVNPADNTAITGEDLYIAPAGEPDEEAEPEVTKPEAPLRSEEEPLEAKPEPDGPEPKLEQASEADPASEAGQEQVVEKEQTAGTGQPAETETIIEKEQTAGTEQPPVLKEAASETGQTAEEDMALKTEPAAETALFDEAEPAAEAILAAEAIPAADTVPEEEQFKGTGTGTGHISEMAQARAAYFGSEPAREEAPGQAPEHDPEKTPEPAQIPEEPPEEIPEETAGAGPSEAVPIADAPAEQEIIAEYEYETEKHRIGIMQILLIVIAVILAIEIGILGIRYFAPDSAAAKAIGTAQAQIVNTVTTWIDGIKGLFDSGETAPENGDEDSEDNTAGSGEGQPSEETDAGTVEEEPDPNPTADKDALVFSQLGNNINIGQIKANNALAYRPGRDYGLQDLNNSKPIENNIWQTPENAEPIYYDSSVVGTVIAFDSKWIDYVNNGDKSVLDLLKKDSSAYRKATGFSKAGKIKENFKLLEIGEIRQGSQGFYVWAHEEIQITEKGTVTDKKYNWIYYLEPEDGKMKIVNYIRF